MPTPEDRNFKAPLAEFAEFGSGHFLWDTSCGHEQRVVMPDIRALFQLAEFGSGHLLWS